MEILNNLSEGIGPRFVKASLAEKIEYNVKDFW
jgi:hypothetical protein